jgi:hypothetical protein
MRLSHSFRTLCCDGRDFGMTYIDLDKCQQARFTARAVLPGALVIIMCTGLGGSMIALRPLISYI